MRISPHYSKSFRFYYVGLLGLFLCGCYLLKAPESFNSRWNTETIVLTHLFTLFFLLPFFLGSLTQLLPVLFGIQHKRLDFYDRLFYMAPLATSFLLYSFHHNIFEKNYLLLAVLVFFWFLLLKFSWRVVKDAIESFHSSGKSMYLHLFICKINFAMAIAVSVWLSAIHFGINLPYFRPHMTNLHLTLFILGFLYHLFVSISQHVIPMFFITKPVDEKILKRQALMPLFVLCYLITQSILPLLIIVKLLISSLILNYVYCLHQSLVKRKRKNKDPAIKIWHLFFFFVFLSTLVWNLLSFESQYNDKLEILLGISIFFGSILSLIMAMIVKIIPFLLWQDLSLTQTELAKFHTILPNTKDFFTDNKIQIVFYAIIAINIAMFLTLTYLAGFFLIFFSLLIVHQIITSLTLHKNQEILLNDNATDD